MFTRFVTSGYRNVAFELYKTQTRGFFENPKEVPKAKTGEEALEHVRILYEHRDYENALREITKIEEDYPQYTKAAKYYRGKTSMALLEQDGTLARLKIKNK